MILSLSAAICLISVLHWILTFRSSLSKNTFHRIRRNGPLLVSSGNHDGDSRNAANEAFAEWLLLSRTEVLFVDGESALLGEARHREVFRRRSPRSHSSQFQ